MCFCCHFVLIKSLLCNCACTRSRILKLTKYRSNIWGVFCGSRNQDTGMCKYSQIYLNIMIKLWMRNGECCVVELLIGSDYCLFPLCAGDEFISWTLECMWMSLSAFVWVPMSVTLKLVIAGGFFCLGLTFKSSFQSLTSIVWFCGKIVTLFDCCN